MPTGMKITLDFTGLEFKQQYIQLLAQQLPLAEIDKMKASDVTITIGTGNAAVTLADNTAVKVIADHVPVKDPEEDDD